MVPRTEWRTLGALLAFVFLMYAVSPNATPFDSRWSVHTAVSILWEGNTNLNEYLPLIERNHFYGVECVNRDGSRKFPIRSSVECPNGNYFAFHPVAVPVLALPAVAALRVATRVLRPALEPLAARMPTETQRSLLRGDLIGSSAAVELLVASLIMAVATALFYRAARECLDRSRALVLALLFVFCSPAWSLASRALWQHGPSMMLLILVLLLLLRAEARPAAVSYLGLPLSLAFFLRPTNAVAVVAMTVIIVCYHRRRLAGYILSTAPVTLAFCAYSTTVYGTLLAPYSFVARTNQAGLSLHDRFLEALVGNLASPGRGLLVYVPLLLLVPVGIMLPLVSEQERRLRPFLVAIVGAHWVLVSSYEDWIGGHSYGPRYMTDIVPFLFFLLVPVMARVDWQRSAMAAVLILLAGASLWIHYLGAWRWEVWEWNSTPTDVNQSQARVWDWSDPPFLRTYRSLPRSTQSN